MAPAQNPGGLGTFPYNLRFPGQYYQTETGVNYNYFRDYDPQMGRYIESDPIGLAGGQLSTYAYVRENPISRRDPLGLLGFDGLTGGISPMEAQGLSIQQMANNVIQALSVAFGFSFEVSTINPVTSGGCGAYGFNFEHTACEGSRWYKYGTPNNSSSFGFLPGISFTGNLAIGVGSWTGPFNNIGAAYGPVTVGGFQSEDSGDFSGYFGGYFGGAAGPPGLGQTVTNYSFLSGH